MHYSHTAKVDGHKFTVSVEYDGEIYPNAYRWRRPVAEIRGFVRYGRRIISRVTGSMECPTRSYGDGDISETLYGALWGRAGSDLARGIRRDLPTLPERERAFVAALTETE